MFLHVSKKIIFQITLKNVFHDIHVDYNNIRIYFIVYPCGFLHLFPSTIPGEVSDWKLFRTNPIYSEICIRANANSSDSIRKSFQSRLIQISKNPFRLNPRLRIRMSSDQFFSCHASEIGIIRVGRLELSRMEWDWILVRIKNLALTRIDF